MLDVNFVKYWINLASENKSNKFEWKHYNQNRIELNCNAIIKNSTHNNQGSE